MNDEDFKRPELSMEPFEIEIPPSLAEEHIKALRLMVGAENLFTDTYSRTRASYGAAAIDALRLRQRIVENIADVVLCPRSQGDVEAIVGYCHEHRIPAYVNGGGSSVTRGKEAVKGGVSLEMSAHLNKVVAFNQVQPDNHCAGWDMGARVRAHLERRTQDPGSERALYLRSLSSVLRSFQRGRLGRNARCWPELHLLRKDRGYGGCPGICHSHRLI